jgi:hypothetical protein
MKFSQSRIEICNMLKKDYSIIYEKMPVARNRKNILFNVHYNLASGFDRREGEQ